MAPLSFWHDSLEPGDSLAPRPALVSDCDADVVVIGAGCTGLWTAHSLLSADPSMRIVVLERDVAGFGASGRNGGWCVGDYGGPEKVVAKAGGAGSVERMAREMHRSVDAVGAVVAQAGIDCGFHKGGALYFAVNEGQWRRVRQHHDELVRQGLGDAWTLLDAKAAAEVVHTTGTCGGLITPHAAAVNPARLARGLAREVERLGGAIHERTAVRTFEKGTVRTEHGTVRAEVVVLATEAYTRTIDGHDRDMLPLANTVIATDPIPDSTWASIGLGNRELFEYASNMLGYGQRTADNRIVWGGLSASYQWKMGIPPSPHFVPPRGPPVAATPRRPVPGSARHQGHASVGWGAGRARATCYPASATTAPPAWRGVAATPDKG